MAKTQKQKEREAAERQRQKIKQAAIAAHGGLKRAPVLAQAMADAVAAEHGGVRPSSSVAQAMANAVSRNPVDSLLDLPAGSYDPAIDYQSGAANRGLGYQHQDYDTGFAGFADGMANRPPDLEARNPDGSYKYGRAVRDYFQNLDRSNQQFDWQRDDTARGYRDLGNNQLQDINQRGLLGGGALAQALAKRSENEGRDQGRIQTGRAQTLADLLTGTTRSATDAYTGLGRAIGENAPYQATLLTQAVDQARPSLVDNPNYEMHNGVLYMRMPGGGVKPVTGSQGGSNGQNGVTAPSNSTVTVNAPGGLRAPDSLAAPKARPMLGAATDPYMTRRRRRTGGFTF